jgi:hypothetical protein
VSLFTNIAWLHVLEQEVGCGNITNSIIRPTTEVMSIETLFFGLMEVNNILDCDLTSDQWKTVEALIVLLKPFMFAQQALEGESYVTISLVFTIIRTIRGEA